MRRPRPRRWSSPPRRPRRRRGALVPRGRSARDEPVEVAPGWVRGGTACIGSTRNGGEHLRFAVSIRAGSGIERARAGGRDDRGRRPTAGRGQGPWPDTPARGWSGPESQRESDVRSTGRLPERVASTSGPPPTLRPRAATRPPRRELRAEVDLPPWNGTATPAAPRSVRASPAVDRTGRERPTLVCSPGPRRPRTQATEGSSDGS